MYWIKLNDTHSATINLFRFLAIYPPKRSGDSYRINMDAGGEAGDYAYVYNNLQTAQEDYDRIILHLNDLSENNFRR